MKTSITKLLILFLSVIYTSNITAQLTLSCNPVAPCAGPTATAEIGLYTPVPLAVGYSWTAVGGPSTLTPIAPTGSAVTGIFNAGIYTITIFPYTMSGTTPVLIATAIVSTTINVGSGPTTTIVSTSNNICIGGSATLTAFGATTYTWSNGVYGQSTVINPLSSLCVSVAASNPGTCGSINSICLNVTGPLPLNVVPGTTSVCQGSSQTFTASGAATYTWDNSVSTSTFNILPTSTAMHTLVGTNAMGCTGTYTFSVWVDTTCANVWPGDANSDGIVGTADVLELGLQATSTGPVRSPGGNAYTSQYASVWTGSISTGKNKCHADCNGDGTVNINDTVTIYNNFSLTHAFKPGAAAAEQITLVPNLSQVQIGRWNTINLVLGSAANQVQALGIDFELSFDNTKIVPDSIWIEYLNSAFTANNQYIPFRKTQFNNGKLYGAITRAGGANVNVGGPIAILHYKADAQLTDGSTLNFALGTSQKMQVGGISTAINGDSKTLTATKNLSGIVSNSAQTFASMYPNPAKENVTVKGKTATAYKLNIFDLTGRVVEQHSFISEVSVDVTAFDNGMYLFELRDANGSKIERISVVH